MVKQVMSEVPSSIIPCPECKVKTGSNSFTRIKFPLCAKCKAKLVTEEENETQVWFGKSIKRYIQHSGPRAFGRTMRQY